MIENHYFKKLAKFRYKADTHHARADMLSQRNRHKKSGKYEGKAQHFEMKIKRTCDKLALYTIKLKDKETHFRALGKNYKAEKLVLRIKYINQRLKEIMKNVDVSESPIREVYKEMQIIKEIVRIPCKFCGTYVDHTETKCPGCGGSLKL
jgi:hypothetical protein